MKTATDDAKSHLEGMENSTLSTVLQESSNRCEAKLAERHKAYQIFVFCQK